MTTMPSDDHVAQTTHAMFIFAGACEGWQEEYSEAFSGQDNFAAWIVRERIDALMKNACDALFAVYGDFPGVFLYEVSESFGAWLVKECNENWVMSRLNVDIISAKIASLMADFISNSDRSDLTQASITCVSIMEDLKNGLTPEQIGHNRAASVAD